VCSVDSKDNTCLDDLHSHALTPRGRNTYICIPIYTHMFTIGRKGLCFLGGLEFARRQSVDGCLRDSGPGERETQIASKIIHEIFTHKQANVHTQSYTLSTNNDPHTTHSMLDTQHTLYTHIHTHPHFVQPLFVQKGLDSLICTLIHTHTHTRTHTHTHIHTLYWQHLLAQKSLHALAWREALSSRWYRLDGRAVCV
jgi:hypothetical protein